MTSLVSESIILTVPNRAYLSPSAQTLIIPNITTQNVSFTTVPTVNNAATQILVRNTLTGAMQYRDVSTIAGGASFDQSLNTTDSPTFVSLTLTAPTGNVTTASSTQTLTNKTLGSPIITDIITQNNTVPATYPGVSTTDTRCSVSNATAAPVIAFSYAIPAGTAILLQCSAVALSDTNNSAVFRAMVRAKNIAGVGTLGTTLDYFIETDVALAASAMTFTLAGTTINVNFTGVVGHTMRFSGEVKIMRTIYV